MKRTLHSLAVTIITLGFLSSCSNGGSSMYDAKADAEMQIEQAKTKAQAEGKMILLQIGGDWCKWCVRLNRFIAEESSIKQFLDEHYVWVHIYYGPENKNLPLMERLGDPQTNGFPVLVVLDSQGNVQKIQATGELESGDSYSKEAIQLFLKSHIAQ